MASTVLPNGIIIPEKYSRDWYNDLYHNWQELDNLLGGGTPKDGTLTIQKNGDTVGTFSANQATDETINITVPDVNDATLTIQKNGTTVDTFTANSSTDKTVDITVPTKTSDLTNDSNFVPSTDLATVATSGSYNDLSNKPTIPTVNNATLTIQQNGTTVDTFTANASSNVTANITVPTKTSDLTNDSGFITSDNTKIPLAGSNQISGSLIPSTDNSIDIGSSTKNLKMLYTKGITINGTQFLPSNYVPRSGGGLNGSLDFSSNWDYASSNQGWFPNTLNWLAGNENVGYIGIFDDSRRQIVLNVLDHNGVMKSVLSAGIDASNNIIVISNNKNVAMREDTVPRSGGAVLTGNELARTANNDFLRICGGANPTDGGYIQCNGAYGAFSGAIRMIPLGLNVVYKEMLLHPDGTWTWTGQAVQLVSDQRLKQQITEIDDKLLDAWEDVNLVQFKYNDAVDEKGGKARLHTGYVVQQIDKACQSHGVDISQYGLYCHEEYPEETEEVEIEQADGTTTKETKVIREASEHYSLRYTEVYAVECMYLRRCIKQLTARIEELEKGNNTK